MEHLILKKYCLNLNLSMRFRAGSWGPVKFNMELSVTTVNTSSKLLPCFVTNCNMITNILKSIQGGIPMIKCTIGKILKIHSRRSPKNTLQEVFLNKFLAFNTKWSKCT